MEKTSNSILYIFIHWCNYRRYNVGDEWRNKYPLLFSTSIMANRGGGVGWNLPIWFLLSLFIVKVAFNYLIKKIKASMICIFAFILAFTINFYSIEYPCYLGNVCVGMCFYSLGFIFKDIQYKRWILYLSSFTSSLSS